MQPGSCVCDCARICVCVFIMLGSGVFGSLRLLRHKCVFEFSNGIISPPDKINLRLVDSQGGYSECG